MGPFEILCGVAAIIFALYYYMTANYDFWESRGVRGPRPILLFGNFKDVIFNKIFTGDYLTKIYNVYKEESMIGIFANKLPILILKNPDLIKDVLIKDFPVFADRGFPYYKKTEPLSQSLFSLEPEKWRPLRLKLSSVFTSSKLRDMFCSISECADHLVEYIENVIKSNDSIECRELTAKYTTDVIGNCAFGIEMNALSNESSEFREKGRKFFAPTWRNILRRKITRLFPGLYEILGYIIPETEITQFFTRIVIETMDYREKNNIIKKDFIDSLRELRKLNKLDDIDLTDDYFIAAQAFSFFLAGFETSSTTISNALYELALNQEIQNNLRKEIDEIYKKYDKNLTYENINEMNYLDKIIKETLRKYPPVTFLMRESTSNYTFDGTKVNIPKNQKVWIPIYAIHRDPDIYPKPDIFDPERFNEEVVQSRHPMSYHPFGNGPRNCIGIRFANYQSKIGLVKILRSYKFETCEKTPIPYINDRKEILLLIPQGGIHLKITKINRS